MPKKELSRPDQIEHWLIGMGDQLHETGEITLIGSGAILWHAFQKGVNTPLPENSMDVDPITESEEVASICYDCLIGSEFEQREGWHVNLMPKSVLQKLPPGWKDRTHLKQYGKLHVTVPGIPDLLAPKLERGEPRDKKHVEYANTLPGNEPNQGTPKPIARKPKTEGPSDPSDP